MMKIFDSKIGLVVILILTLWTHHSSSKNQTKPATKPAWQEEVSGPRIKIQGCRRRCMQ